VGSRQILARTRLESLLRHSLDLRKELSPNLSVGGSVGGLASKRNSFPLTQTCLRSGPFAPRSLPASPLLWACPTPGRSRSQGYGFPQDVGGLTRHPAGPARFLDGSVLARRPQAPRRVLWLLLPITSPQRASFIQRGRLAAPKMNPFTRPNRFAFAMAHEFAFPGFASRIAPTHAGSATCMNRQFTWSAPHS